jgi:hypothetical protein
MLHVANMGEIRTMYKIVVQKPEGNVPIGRPRHRWKGYVKRNFKETGERVYTEFIWLKIGSSGGPL